MAEDKPETEALEEKAAPTESIALVPDQTLGQYLTAARERRGFTRDRVVADAHVPEHYVKMLESDSYGMIADQLYLVPFVRRYATFLGLDPEEVAMRFVGEVQHAEGNFVRMSEPITMARRKSGGAIRKFAVGGLILAGLIVLAGLAMRRLGYLDDVSAPTAVASPAMLPPSTIVTAPPAVAPSNAVPEPPAAPAQGPAAAAPEATR